MNPDQFGKGAYKDKYDSRDYMWSEVGFGLPPFDWLQSFDIENKLGVKLPVKNQGLSSSCGGCAWASYASVLEDLADKTLEERSAKYIYAQTHVPGGGTYGRDNADLFVNQGVAREALLTSYINGQPPTEDFMIRSQDIMAAERIDATNDRSLCYANVTCDIDTVAQVLQANNGVILGVTGSNNGTWLSPNPQPPVSSVDTWNHWVYAGKAKMNNGIKQIKILNSWGVEVGEQGWQWLSENYFPAGIFQVWTHTFNPNSIPSTFHYHFTKAMKYGDSNTDVKMLQTALQVDGTFPSTVAPTGFYGTITCKAVLDFQLKYKLADTAYLVGLGGKNAGPLTLTKLNSLFNK
jgi:hypothetical protein